MHPAQRIHHPNVKISQKWFEARSTTNFEEEGRG
jgi:hypothetical protein